METREPINTPPVWILKRIHWRAWLPSRGNVLFTLVIIFAMFWAQSARALPWMEQPAVATSTGSWPYQGRLADSAGTPITATVPMIFRLYNAPGSGATPLWEEQWTGPNSVQVSDGLFNVMLGSLTAIPQSIVNGNNSLWLGITAGTDNEMTPRVQLGSVPFAAQALTVPDGSIGTAKLANGSVTQAKAPSLVNSANIPNTHIYFGTETVSATSAQTVLSKTITISPACSNMRVFLQPHQNFRQDVVALNGVPWTTDSFTAVFFTASGSGWSSGQFQNFDWFAICQ